MGALRNGHTPTGAHGRHAASGTSGTSGASSVPGTSRASTTSTTSGATTSGASTTSTTPTTPAASTPSRTPVTPVTPAALATPAAATAAASGGEALVRVRKKRKHAKKKRPFLIALGIIVALLLVLAAALGGYLYNLNKNLSLSDDESESLRTSLLSTDELSDDEAFYMLVLGSDARENDTASRADVILLVRVDPSSGQLTLVSIPRDTKVEIDGYGTCKINASYAYGGASGAVDAVSEFSGIEISHYAEIHFEELEELVDMLGGVWVDVPVSNTQTGSSNTGVEILEGEQLMDGETALAFARERYGYIAGDFQRTENQRILATAIINQVLETSPLNLLGTVQQLASCVSTDLSISDIVTLVQAFQTSDVTTYSAMVPSTTKTISGVSYVLTTEPDWSEMMAVVDAGGDPNTYDETTTESSSDEAESESESETSESTSDSSQESSE